MQIRENFSSSSMRLLAEEALNHLDEKGFLGEAPVNGDVLEVLQTFDPPGIFARDLREAFLLQLKAKGKGDGLAYRLVKNCFEDLLYGRYTAIKKKLSLVDLGSAIHDLTKLSFRPASAFNQDPVSLVRPELYIDKIETGWTLALNEDELPKFHIQTDYLEIEPEFPEEKEILRTFKAQAKWIVRSLNRRRSLLRKLGRILICKQARYLDQKGPLALLTVREVAEKLEVHESTLSRALSGKYVSTPRGILPLRALISSTPEAVSAREILQKLIEEEDKRSPLTDDHLATALKAKGYLVARRTIAKYRSQLKIGPAARRKHL
jgi:RNA polymerase sigma-54 factor